MESIKQQVLLVIFAFTKDVNIFSASLGTSLGIYFYIDENSLLLEFPQLAAEDSDVQVHRAKATWNFEPCSVAGPHLGGRAFPNWTQ